MTTTPDAYPDLSNLNVLDRYIPRILLGSKELPLNQAHIRNVMKVLFGTRETPELARATFSMRGENEDRPLLRNSDDRHDPERRLVWECASTIQSSTIPDPHVTVRDISGERYEYVYQYDCVASGYEALVREGLFPAPRLPWRWRSGPFAYESETPRSLLELFSMACYEPQRLQVIEELAITFLGLTTGRDGPLTSLAWDVRHPTGDNLRSAYEWSLPKDGSRESEMLTTLRRSAADFLLSLRSDSVGVVKLFTPACWRPWRSLEDVWRR